MWIKESLLHCRTWFGPVTFSCLPTELANPDVVGFPILLLSLSSQCLECDKLLYASPFGVMAYSEEKYIIKTILKHLWTNKITKCEI